MTPCRPRCGDIRGGRETQMMRQIYPPLALRAGLPVLFLGLAALPPTAPAATAINFERKVLSELYQVDGIAWGEIDRDGRPDIVAGPYWYAGPDCTQRHEYYPPNPLPPEVPATENMFSFVHDFNGNGLAEILTASKLGPFVFIPHRQP